MLFSTALFSGKLFDGLLFKVIRIGEKITNYGNVLSKTTAIRHVNQKHIEHARHIEHTRHHKRNSHVNIKGDIKIQNDALMAIIMSKLK